jgi:hypothetical protein
LRRFLLFALPLLVLTMALFHFALEMFGLAAKAPRLAGLDGAAAGPSPGVLPFLPGLLPSWAVLGTWCLEALGLAALFLLIHGRMGASWANGLLAGWIAWVFRGPLLVVSVAGAGLPPGPWWAAALSWWVLYSLCGLLLGVLAEGSGLRP